MAYVEVWKSGRLVTRRRVDEQKAQKGCRVRLGSAGEVRVAVGQSETLGELEVHMFAGEPPPAWQEVKKTMSRPPHDEQSLPPLSMETPGLRAEHMDRYPDIEGYKIIEPLGEGGMGIVWRAEQLSTRRQVALKLMVSHRIESPKAQARFQREVELTARLDHPNIARIYDSGLHQGMYYYAMELVDGVPLDRYIKSKALSQDQILALMRTVCQALLFAHLRAVIHRDLKPSNILVSADGQPHVLDFGLAKALLEEDKALTISVEGQIAGTPAYMSPEQAAGHHSQTDTRTDVYSLGVILYELLTGQSPFDLSGSMFDLLQQITEGKIRRPREITKSIGLELEAILFKALALKPDDRYASGGALAKDISNYLDGDPLDAQVPTILYFFRKKARKYRLQVGVAVALLAVLIFAYTKAIEHRTELKTAEKELQIQARKTGLTEAKLEWVDLELKVLGKKEEDARAALRVLRDRYISTQEKVGDLQHKLGEVKPPVQVRRIGLDHGEPLSPAALVRQPSVPQDVQSWTLETCGHRGRIVEVVYSPDGNRLASAGHDGTVRIWNVKSGELAEIFVVPAGGIVDLVWSVDSKHLKGTSSDGTIQLWDTKDDRLLRAFRAHREGVTCLAISPDGKRLASGGRDSMVQLWAIDSHGLSASSSGELNGGIGRLPVAALVWSPNGDMLVSGDDGGNVQIWGPDSREPIHRFKANCGSINSLTWSPDGRLLVCGGSDGTAQVWDAKNEFRNYVVLLPLWGSNRVGVAISPAGDYRGTEGIEKYLRYVVQSDDGQRTLTSAEYRSYFGWVNEPWQVGLHVPGSEKITRIYVNAAAQGPYDGKSWATAFDDLQNALSVAQPNTEIWVAAGTYRPDRGTGARRASFYLKNGVRLLGGFVGTETSSHERDPNKYETILSGDLNSDDVEIVRPEVLPEEPTRGENGYHVVNASGTDPNAVLDGFIITAGNANGPKEHNQRSGGGMYNSYGSPTILNCIFKNNSATGDGGGMYNERGGPTLVDCTFDGNLAERGGGGIYNTQCSGNYRPSLTRCSFISNCAKGIGPAASGGGGICNANNGSPILADCRFINNSAITDGGGMYNVNGSGPILTNCTFNGNTAEGGGGLYQGAGETKLIHCTFHSNSGGWAGGGIHCSGATLSLVSCTLTSNSAEGGGGAIYNHRSNLTLTNCRSVGNFAGGSGGGIYDRGDSSLKLTNCTFTANKSGANGGGLYNEEKSSSEYLTNCVLWGNSDSDGMDESAQIDASRLGKMPAISNCCIQGWSGKLGGVGNFGADPLFIDPDGPDDKMGTEDDDLRLRPNSPCIDNGSNSALPPDTLDLDNDGDTEEPLPLDIEGKSRILNSTVDIGAYENG